MKRSITAVTMLLLLAACTRAPVDVTLSPLPPPPTSPAPSASPILQMPDVVGMVFSQARDALKARGFSVKRVDKYSMTKTAEHILKQSWRVGAIVPADSTVRLTVAIPFPPPVNGNPWDYNWACCKKIFDPPSEFCSFFSCVTTFHNGEGYVVQCRDGLFSATGGSKRVCSTHDGHDRTLLQP